MTESTDSPEPDWLALNRAHWDEVTPIHVDSAMYDQSELRAGHGELDAVAESELPLIAPDGWDGLRVLHLQCHFGADTLALAQRGATVVGIDFSHPAVEQARALAAELGLADRARFIESNVYDARHALPEPESFDVVFITWGTIGWLPDVFEWARIIAWFLKPGGRLYFADGHPAAFVFDDFGKDEMPVFGYAYNTDGLGDRIDEDGDYADEDANLSSTVTHEWTHPLSDTITAITDAGLRIDFFHEHYRVPWRMFRILEQRDDGMWGWADKKWLPLGFSIGATQPGREQA